MACYDSTWSVAANVTRNNWIIMLTVTSESFKGVDVIINLLLEKTHCENILRRTISCVADQYVHHTQQTLQPGY